MISLDHVKLFTRSIFLTSQNSQGRRKTIGYLYIHFSKIFITPKFDDIK